MPFEHGSDKPIIVNFIFFILIIVYYYVCLHTSMSVITYKCTETYLETYIIVLLPQYREKKRLEKDIIGLFALSGLISTHGYHTVDFPDPFVHPACDSTLKYLPQV